MTNSIPTFSFPKSEKLCSQALIQELFQKGSSVFLYPFKVIYLENQLDADFPQILISVSRKTFKRAVHRNRLKRQIREVYRLHKNQFFTQKKPSVLAFIYVGKKLENFDLLKNRLLGVMKNF